MKTSKTLTAEESLAIITSMIQTTKGNLQGSSFYFLLWGWVVICCNLGEYLISEFTDYPNPYIVWLLIIPAWGLSIWRGYTTAKKATVTTYADAIIKWVWLCFFVGMILIVSSGKFQELIPAVILILAGTCTFITGCILKFKPLIYGGSAFWIFSALILGTPSTYAPLISAIAIFIGYIVPGYLLKKA